MFSLFCVVCVVAQPTLSTVHAAAIVIREIHVMGFIDRSPIVDEVQAITSEGDSGSDLRSMCHDIELKVILLEVATKRPITNLSKDAMR